MGSRVPITPNFEKQAIYLVPTIYGHFITVSTRNFGSIYYNQFGSYGSMVAMEAMAAQLWQHGSSDMPARQLCIFRQVLTTNCVSIDAKYHQMALIGSGT